MFLELKKAEREYGTDDRLTGMIRTQSMEHSQLNDEELRYSRRQSIARQPSSHSYYHRAHRDNKRHKHIVYIEESKGGR
jgi:hypothetical protein